jgi:hypothetical protein
MDVERIRQLRLSKPFRPFTLVLKDGRKLNVDLPFRLAISPVGNEVTFGSNDGPMFIAVSSIDGVELGPVAETSPP